MSSSEKQELVLLERVFMRLAVADTDEKLIKALSTLLVPVLNVGFFFIKFRWIFFFFTYFCHFHFFDKYKNFHINRF